MENKKQKSPDTSSSCSISSGEYGTENLSLSLNVNTAHFDSNRPETVTIEKKLLSLKLQIKDLVEKVNINDSILAEKTQENEELRNTVIQLKQRTNVLFSLDNSNIGCCSNCVVF